MIVIVILGAACFSTFSLIIACLVKTRERFMGIGQVLTMPLFFASNAIYPIVLMPVWLQAIARCNPLSYEVDALRDLMLVNGISASTPFVSTMISCSAGDLYASISEQPDAEPPETTQHSRPSTGHEQQQTTSACKREYDLRGRSAKR